MSKEQIEEMVEISRHVCEGECFINKDGLIDCDVCRSLHFYGNGYRKQSAVIDEFAERLKEKMDDLARMKYNDEPYFLVSKAFIDKIAAEMKVGAE